jgi:endonuclease G
MPGVSVGQDVGLPGTIGAIVYDNRSGIPCLLSNAHVLAAPAGASGGQVVQPGASDDANVSGNIVGKVLRVHIGLAGDCAIASLEQRLFREQILELNAAPRRMAKVQVGDTIIKSGRSSGVTRGIVSRAGVVFRNDYGTPLGIREIGGFEVQIDPAAPPPDENLTKGGDSGSLWLIYEGGSATDIAVGLHFASQEDPLGASRFALACNIHSVIDILDVSFAPRV